MAKITQELLKILTARLETHSKKVTDENLDINAYDEHGYTLLHYRTALGHEEEINKRLYLEITY